MVDRLRVPPRERFSGSQRVFDLDDAFAELPAESVPRQGHMQKVLYRLGPVTTAIFDFESGGGLEKYTVDGEAIIHVISGELQVRTGEGSYPLTANQMLLLNPGVPHDLQALKPTRLLLTVVLQDPERGE